MSDAPDSAIVRDAGDGGPQRPPRPPQAHPSEPHWVVIRTTGAKRIPGKPEWRNLYRHTTSEGAIAEADRLAARHPGKLFIVYEAVHRAAVEPPAPGAIAEALS